jgi:hypothetical protein
MAPIDDWKAPWRPPLEIPMHLIVEPLKLQGGTGSSVAPIAIH